MHFLQPYMLAVGSRHVAWLRTGTPSQGLTACDCVVVLQQDLAATAIAGGELPEEQSPEEIAGDYAWDCEYNFDLVVSL
jgi:hypothetical protein